MQSAPAPVYQHASGPLNTMQMVALKLTDWFSRLETITQLGSSSTPFQ